MSYLIFNSSVFLGNYDSLVESCFNYAYEREDECLFEEMVLQELSQGKKIRAAKIAQYYADPLSFTMNAMHNAQDKLKDAKKSRESESGKKDAIPVSQVDLKSSQEWASQHGKALAGKRNRLFKFLQNVPIGTEYSIDGTETSIIGKSTKDSLQRISQMMSDENAHKEYNELRKELEELNKDNPRLKKNQYRLFKTTVQQSAPVNNKLVPMQTSSDNKNEKEEAGSKKEQEQTQNTGNTKETVNNNSKSENSDKASRIAKIKSRIKGIIDSLKKKYDEIKKNINNTPPEKRSLLQKFMNKIIQMIDKFKGLLNK